MRTFGSLFAGIEGFGLGFERAGWECRWQVELNDFATKILEARFPSVPRFRDVREVGRHCLEAVDAIVGGFPCQDISDAHTSTERLGLKGRLSGLWWKFCRIVRELQPKWVFVENVAAWKRWVPVVRRALWRRGYATVPLRVSAGSFGAPHPRPRVFVVAHANRNGEPLRALHEEVARLRPISIGGGNWRTPPPGGFRVDDGVPNGMDRVRTLGNSVSPVVSEWLASREVLRA